MKDSHKGETGLLVANGPSLEYVKTDIFEKYPTMGMNRIYKPINPDLDESGEAIPDTGYQLWPDYYCLIGRDQVDTPEKRAVYNEVIGRAKAAFVNRDFVKHWEGNIHGILSHSEDGKYQGKSFSFDPLKRIALGFTNTYPCMQIMYWMGFKTVLLVGLDNDYGADPEKRHYFPDTEEESCEPFGGRERTMEGSNYVFHLARMAFEADGRRLIQLTKTSKTPALEKGRLEDWL